MKYADFEINGSVVFIKVNPVSVPIEDYKRDFIDMKTKMLQELPSSYWIFDARHTKLLPSEHRIAAGNWMKQNSDLIKQRVKAVFMVECNFWTEIMLKSIFLIIKPPVPFYILKKAEDAHAMLKDKYEIEVPQLESAQA